MLYVQEEILAHVGKSGLYLQLAKELLPIKRRCGWTLVGVYARVMGSTLSVGDRNIYELWEIAELGAVQALLRDPEYLALSEEMIAAIARENRKIFEPFAVTPEAAAVAATIPAPKGRPLYLHASLHLRRGAKAQFRELISTCVPIFGQAGWKLLGSYSSVTGENDSIIDFWEIPDGAAVERAMHDERLMPLLPKIHRNIVDEIFTLLTKLPVEDGA